MEETKKDEEFEQVVKNAPPPVIPKEAVRTGDKGKVTKKKEKPIVLKNVKGEDMDEADYFFGGKALPTFNDVCGMPVEREELIEVFNKIFNVKDDILFYKTSDKEVYLVIVPIKNSTVIDESNESMPGDFQKHAISFIQEGSVNLETLKMKLRRIIPFLKFADR
jgi:hypothetical protein